MNARSHSRMDDSQDARVRADLLASVRAEPRTRRAPRRPRRRTIAGVATVIALGGVLAATAWVHLAPASTIEHRVTCFAEARLDAPKSTGQDFPGEEPDRDGRTALDECRALWSAGAIGAPSSLASGSGTSTVPPLQLCLLAEQTYAVFPDLEATGSSDGRAGNARFCSALGLAPGPE